jgi:Na+/H+-translocating membrane pyrophosphatase
VLPATIITADIWSAYSVGNGIYGVAPAAAALLSMARIVVAAAILTPIGMPILMVILPMLPILSIATNAMDSFVNMA